MKVLLDFVPNHTSDRHPWFEESRSDPHSTRRSWYVWRPGNGLPNNWASSFGGRKSPPTCLVVTASDAHEPKIASPTTQRRRRQNARMPE